MTATKSASGIEVRRGLLPADRPIVEQLLRPAGN